MIDILTFLTLQIAEILYRGVAASRFLGRQELVAYKVYDQHPHGLVHVGHLQDVQTVVPVIQEAHLRLITVSSSVMQFCKLLLFSTQELGVKSWGEPLPIPDFTSKHK